MKILSLEEALALPNDAYVVIAVPGTPNRNYKALCTLFGSGGGGGGGGGEDLDETLALGNISNRHIHLFPTNTHPDTDWNLSIGINDPNITPNESGVMIRSVRKPNARIQIYDDSGAGDPNGLDCITFDFRDYTNIQRFVFSAREFRFNYGALFHFTGGQLFAEGPTGENAAYSRRGLGYDFRYSIQKSGSGIQDIEVVTILFEENAHVLIGSSTDNGFRFQIKGDTHIKGGLAVMPLLDPTFVAIGTSVGTAVITYRIIGRNKLGRKTVQYEQTITNAPNTLDPSNQVYLTIDNDVVAPAGYMTRLSGTAYYDVYRVATTGSPSSIGKIGTKDASGRTYNGFMNFFDNGLVGDGVNVSSLVNTTGNIGVGTETPEGVMDIVSTTQAFIPPRMTQTQRDAMPLVKGGHIYNLTTDQMNYWNGTVWIAY